MKKCLSCGFENPEDGKFCRQCGTKLEEKKLAKFCRFCGKPALEGNLFCTGCGKSLEMIKNSPVVIPEQVEEIKPAQVQEQKLVQVQEQKPAQVQEQKPAQVQEQKPAQVQEQKPVQVQEQKPVQVQKQKKKSVLPMIIIISVVIVALGIGAFWFMQSGLLEKDDSKKDSDKKNTQMKEEENDKDSDKKDNEDEKESLEFETEILEIETEMEDEVVEETELPEVSENIDRAYPISLDVLSYNVSSSFDNRMYAAEFLWDGNAATSWAEGVRSYGVGEHVTVTLREETMVYGMAILPGDLTSIEAFNNCSYPVKFHVTAEGKTQEVEITQFNCNFDFTKNPYVYLDFPEPVNASEVQIMIAGVHENVNSDMTCIAELRLYTYPEIGEVNNYSEEPWLVEYVKNNTDYLLPTSNSEYLTMEDLEGFTAEDCRIARNELYARHGRRFLDETLQAYFDAKSWYTGTIEPDDFNDLEWLNEYELANRDLIVEYEETQGYR